MGLADNIRSANEIIKNNAQWAAKRGQEPTPTTSSPEASFRKNFLNARSGNNVRFTDGVEISENYKNSLADVIKFYQDEFKITPHANVKSNPNDLGFSTQAVTWLDDRDGTGQREVNFRNLRESDEERATRGAKNDTNRGWSVANSGDISHVPVHEFGHVVADMLFPRNEKGERNKNLQQLYIDSLKDAGFSVEKGGDLNKQANDILNNMSGYAAATGLHYMPAPFKNDSTNIADEHEVVAEALSDYYYNRDKATDLSKAIVKRIKNKGAMYGMKKAGGLKNQNESFVQNLRRYRVIQ